MISSDTKNSMMFDFCGKQIRPEEQLNMTQIRMWLFTMITGFWTKSVMLKLNLCTHLDPLLQNYKCCRPPLQHIGRVYYFSETVVQKVNLKFKNL